MMVREVLSHPLPGNKWRRWDGQKEKDWERMKVTNACKKPVIYSSLSELLLCHIIHPDVLMKMVQRATSK